MNKSACYFKIATMICIPIILNMLFEHVVQIFHIAAIGLAAIFAILGLLSLLHETGILKKIQKMRLLLYIRKIQFRLYGSLILIFPCLLLAHYSNDIFTMPYIIIILSLINVLFVFLYDIPKLRTLHNQYNNISL